MRVGRVLALVGVVFAFGACERLADFDRSLEGEGDYVLDGAYVTWDTAREAFARVDLSSADGGHPTTWHETEGSTRVTRVGPTGQALLVLSPDERSLTVLYASAETAAATRFDLGHPFGEMSVSEDGAYLVAYAGADVTSTGTVAVSHNLLALVALGQAPGETNPVARSVSSYGGARLGVDISPEFLVDASPHRLAVVRSEGHVALVDLMAPTAEPTAVPLVVPGDPTDLRTRPARFALRESGRGGLWIFLTAEGSGDVIALEIGGKTDTEGAATPGLATTLNQHAVGGWVSDALPVRASDGRLYVVALAATSRLLKTIDAETGESQAFSLDLAYATLTRFDVPDADGIERPYVLLSRLESRHFATLALDEVAERGVKALRERSLRTNYEDLLPVPGQPRFVAFGSGGSELALVWLTREAAEDTVAFAGTRRGHVFSRDGGALHLLVEAGGASHLVRIALDSGQLSELALFPGAQSLHVLPGSGDLLVVHDEPLGLLTLFPAADVTADGGEAIMGFLLEGVFDE